MTSLTRTIDVLGHLHQKIRTDFVTFSCMISEIRSYYKNCKVHKEIEQDSETFLKNFAIQKTQAYFLI